MISKLYTIISNKLWDLSLYFGDLYNRWVITSQQKALGPYKYARFRAMQTYRNLFAVSPPSPAFITLCARPKPPYYAYARQDVTFDQCQLIGFHWVSRAKNQPKNDHFCMDFHRRRLSRNDYNQSLQKSRTVPPDIVTSLVCLQNHHSFLNQGLW